MAHLRYLINLYAKNSPGERGQRVGCEKAKEETEEWLWLADRGHMIPGSFLASSLAYSCSLLWLAEIPEEVPGGGGQEEEAKEKAEK